MLQGEKSVDSQAFAPLVDQAVVITGATATGKTAVALAVAESVQGEIISVDSVAVYRGMDIGSAKPSSEDRSRVRHHLLDVVKPSQSYSVAEYLSAAHTVVAEIRSRGRLPIFVGGTPMYLKGILRGFDPGPPPDWRFRAAVEADVERFGVHSLRQRLEQIDPLAAHRIGTADVRRMIRALEVARATGTPLSHRQTQFDQGRNSNECLVFSLQWTRDVLHNRIAARVKQMFERGLVGEVQQLVQTFGSLSRTAAQAVGYREVLAHLADEISLDQTREQVLFHTRQLARRQETWLRSLQEVRVVSRSEEDSSEKIAQKITDCIREHGGLVGAFQLPV